MYLAMKIPTRHGMWKVCISPSLMFGNEIKYYCKDRLVKFFWNPIHDLEVPKTIRIKARCFIANPNLFSKRVSF